MKKNNKEKGFTLLETIIAIFILTLSMTAPIYIASMAFRNTIDSRDNISAQYLAEEVIEVLRNKRDEKALYQNVGNSQTAWLENITGSANCFNEKGLIQNRCVAQREISTGNYVFTSCNPICSPLSFDPLASVVYGNTSSSDLSKFTREFYFQTGELDSSTSGLPHNEVILVVNIKWQDKGREKVYTLSERLYAVNYNNYFTK